MKTDYRNTVIVLTGGSSGIGRATAAYLAGRGCTVYELSRHAGDLPDVTHLTADVCDEASVKAALAQVIELSGHIDILINNAGFGISGAVEFTPTEDAVRQLDVNFFGTVRVARAVIPYMRAKGCGRIVNISSVAAPAPIPFQAFYSASKAAINSFSMSLANELRPFGITVTAVMPGDIRTGFTDARKKLPQGDDVYGGRISRSVAGMEKDERGGMDPATAGRFIGKVALSHRRKPLYTIGFSYKLCALLLKLLPAGAANRIIGLLYS